MSAVGPSSAPPLPSPSTSAPPERPPFGPQSRQHSRSSSQLATLASLALSPRGPNASLPASPRLGAPRPLPSLDGPAPPSRRTSVSSDDESDADTPPGGSDGSSSERGRVRQSSGSTAPSTSSAGSEKERQSRKDRRSTFPSLAALPTLTSTSPSPVTSPAAPGAGGSLPSSGRASPSLPPTDPRAPALASFPSTSSSLAQFIQHKRRQASAPYFASARSQSLFSPGAGFSLGPSATEAGAPPPAPEGEDGPRPPTPGRNRSRASSRRATATAPLLALQTAGLAAPAPEDGDGLVVTPTTAEWHVLGSELQLAKEDEAKRAREEEAHPPEEEASERKPPRWKRWPSLSDHSDGEDDDDEDNHFALSLSLSSLSGYKHQLPHTPPPPPAPDPPAPASDSAAASSPAPVRPSPLSAYKSSFSYTSTGSGVTGGFISHSNTSSISRAAAPLSSSASLTSSPAAPAHLHAPGSEPLPALAAFESTHAPQGPKADATLALSPAQAHAQALVHPQPSRPALSRGSLSSATGVLSSPPLGVGDGSAAAGGEETAASSGAATVTGADAPALALPPQVQVLRALDGASPGTGLGVNGLAPPATPPSLAATPFDGDPFASSAPADASVPPTPRGEGDAGYSPALSGAGGEADGLAPVSLDWTRPLGPVDPRTYSAVTGRRDIGSFVCEETEAGKGAYGSVRRARERGRDGRPVGPELVVKYVIKQRILADCWKKHKILGPIPIEVHVLDHLRRVPYEPRPHLNYLSRRGGGAARVPKGLPAHVRRDSAPKLDLWKGGEDGAPVQTGHPNICPLLDFWEDAHHYHLVMPSATAEATSDPHPRHGQDLFDFVDAHPDGLPPAPIQRILAQIADAVFFLHEHSIVHRDIKDENCVLDPDGNVRLIDFGSAAYVKEGRKFDTFSGTLDFAAPEVLKGARYSGKEQDIWALGVLGYVLICGECPFWSPDEAMQGLSSDTRAFAALSAKLPSASSSDEPSMAHAVDLVLRCLEIEPANRPSADMICDHAFFVGGEEGWCGPRGWERAGEEDGEEGV
ncbi:serine/threonine protein kinase [Rhodotorula kratochvilovae]